MAGLLGAELPDPDAGAASLQDPAAVLGLPTLPHLPRPVRILRSSRRGGVLLAAAPWGPLPWEGFVHLGVIPVSGPRRVPGGWNGSECPQPWPCPGTLARTRSSFRQACSGSALLSSEACVQSVLDDPPRRAQGRPCSRDGEQM